MRQLEQELEWQVWQGDPSAWPSTVMLANEAVHAAKAESLRASEQLDFALRQALFRGGRPIALRHEILDVAVAVPTSTSTRSPRPWTTVVPAARCSPTPAANRDVVQCSPHLFLADGSDTHHPDADFRWAGGEEGAGLVPVYGVTLTAVVAAVLTSSALVTVDINGAPVPVASFAVVSIGVIGLYLAFAIPIYLRWRMGDDFVPGSWTLGPRHRWMSIVALVEIGITSIVALLPTNSGGARWYPEFAWKFVNYTILVVPGALIRLWIYWHVSVKHWFTGPRSTVDQPA